jgi:hypothetical protein
MDATCGQAPCSTVQILGFTFFRELRRKLSVQIDATRTLTVSSLFRPECNDVVPQIRLSGRWLAEVVEIGQSVHVTVARDSITITPIHMDKKQPFVARADEPGWITLELPLVVTGGRNTFQQL